jgi:hypothetical protein
MALLWAGIVKRSEECKSIIELPGLYIHVRAREYETKEAAWRIFSVIIIPLVLITFMRVRLVLTDLKVI